MAVLWIVCTCFMASALGALYPERNKDQASTDTGQWVVSPYFNNEFINFTVSNPTLRRQRVTIQYSVAIENSTDCAYDRLVIKAPDPSPAKRLCGIASGVYTVFLNPGTRLLLQFISDAYVNGQGFRVRYVMQDAGPVISLYNIGPRTLPTGKTVDTGGARTTKGQEEGETWGDIGTFISPNYPGKYEGNLDRMYTAHLKTVGKPINVTVRYDIESQEKCLFDFLLVYTTDGVWRLCGQGVNSRVVQVPGNILKLRFVTDKSQNFKGFKLKYQVLKSGAAV